MNILLSINSKFVVPALVLIKSIIDNNDIQINIYILSSDLTMEDRNYFNQFLNNEKVNIKNTIAIKLSLIQKL